MTGPAIADSGAGATPTWGRVTQLARAHRLARQLSQTEVADAAGVHINTIVKVEKGRITIMMVALEAILASVGLELAVVPLGSAVQVETELGVVDPEPVTPPGSPRVVRSRATDLMTEGAWQQQRATDARSGRQAAG